MKKLLVLLALSLFALCVASASPINCTVTGLGSGSAVDGSTVVTCGGLTFDNFDVTGGTNGAPDIVDLIGTPTYDSVTGQVMMNFNPNLSGNADQEFLFQVWGGISGIDMSVGGSDAVVNEIACANPIATSGALLGVCANSAGTQSVPALGTLTVMSDTPDQPVICATCPFNTTSPVYIFKDISAGGGSLSEFTQSFEPGSSVPEPISMILLGSGLLGLGLLRRRSRKD
jgi:hypothetical protein